MFLAALRLAARKEPTKDGLQTGQPVAELTAEVPRRARKAFKKGIKALRKSRPAEAQRRFEEALRLEPEYFQASTALAVLMFDSMLYAAARLFAERAQDVDPQYLPALEVLGALDVVAGDHPEAVEKLAEVIRLSPNRWSAHYYLGLALARQQDCQEASRHLELAAELRSGSEKTEPPTKRRVTSPAPSGWKPWEMPHPRW